MKTQDTISEIKSTYIDIYNIEIKSDETDYFEINKKKGKKLEGKLLKIIIEKKHELDDDVISLDFLIEKTINKKKILLILKINILVFDGEYIKKEDIRNQLIYSLFNNEYINDHIKIELTDLHDNIHLWMEIGNKIKNEYRFLSMENSRTNKEYTNYFIFNELIF